MFNEIEKYRAKANGQIEQNKKKTILSFAHDMRQYISFIYHI